MYTQRHKALVMAVVVVEHKRKRERQAIMFTKDTMTEESHLAFE